MCFSIGIELLWVKIRDILIFIYTFDNNKIWCSLPRPIKVGLLKAGGRHSGWDKQCMHEEIHLTIVTSPMVQYYIKRVHSS